MILVLSGLSYTRHEHPPGEALAHYDCQFTINGRPQSCTVSFPTRLADDAAFPISQTIRDAVADQVQGWYAEATVAVWE